MALIYLYSPLKDGETFTSNQKKAARDGVNITWKQRLCGIGEFSFDIPSGSKLMPFLNIDDIVGIDNKRFGIIREALKRDTENGSIVTVSGVDLNGLIAQRVTLYPNETIAEGLQGYDAINNASTEAVVKYFIKNNITEPKNPKRQIPAFYIAENQNRGKQEDCYMSRFEPLDELVVKNLEPQRMGYSIKLDFKSNRFVFDVIQGLNRSAGQYDNPRVIFNISHKNLISIEYSSSKKNYRNIFYASLSKSKNEAETLTCMYTPNDEDETSGAERFETHLNVSANLPADKLYENMKRYALKDASKFEAVESLTAVPAQKLIFEKDYFLGDIVTLEAKTGFLNSSAVSVDVQVTAVSERWLPSGEIETTLEFGKNRPTRFDLLEHKIQNNG